MAQQTIGIGAAANDGTGDPLRTAFDKCNSNFTELYGSLTGLLDLKGSTDCSGNPDYPAALKGDTYVVSVAGKIGGAAGTDVEVGDVYFALADSAGGDQATVGASWAVLQGNVLAGAGGVAIAVEDEGVEELASVERLNFTGAGCSVSVAGAEATIDVPGGGGGSAIEVQDEGVTETAALARLNFTGAGVTATDDGAGNVEVAIPGGGGGAASFKGAMVIVSATVLAANYSTAAPIPFDEEVYDTDGFHDNVTNNTRLTIPAGVSRVRLGGMVRAFAVTDGNGQSLQVLKNGAGFDGNGYFAAEVDSSIGAGATLSTGVIDVVAGDYFELQFRCTDSSIELNSSTHFWIEVVEGPAAAANEGTAFPVSPTTGDRFYRTDRNIEYFYDGTRWLSTQLHTLAFPMTDSLLPRTATTAYIGRVSNPWFGLHDVYVEDVVYAAHASAAATWTFGIDSPAKPQFGTVALALAATTWTSSRQAVDAVMDSTYMTFNFSMAEDAGSASVYAMATMTYRLVG